MTMQEMTPGPAASALRESEAYFAQLVAGVQDYAIFLLDATGHIRSWNAGAERIKGYRAEEILGQHFSRFYPEEMKASGWPGKELEEAARQGRFEDEGWRLRKDGTHFWANVVITALRDQAGEVLGFLKITRDLSERKQIEDGLRHSEERFRLLIESVEEYAIFMLDPQGHVMSWNVGAHRIKGYTAAEIIGRHFSCFYPPDDVAQGKPGRELESALRDGQAQDEGWRVRKDGSRFWAHVVITPVYDSKRQLTGFAKVTRDLTERQKISSLQEVDRQKNEFLAMLAHELRNPLAPIRNALYILKSPKADAAISLEARELMERQVQHLVRLVDDLLDVSRIMQGRIELKREPLDISTVIAQAVETAKPLMEAQGHKLTIGLPPGPVRVHADLIRLSQALSNILINAAKYSDRNSPVALTTALEGQDVVIKVRDWGVGIAPDMLPRIFDLFVQSDRSLARSQGGLGIGLSLVRKLVELHGGQVTAHSEGPGKGAEFVIRLATLPPAPAQSPESPSDGKRHAGSSTGRRRILVVEDNAAAAATLVMILKFWDYDVRVAHDGEEAIALANDYQPHIVLLDMGLPKLDGYQVAGQLRRQPELTNTLIIAITGYGQAEDRRRSREVGVNHHLVKPIDMEELQKLLGEAQTAA